jgi:hypothetical protein
MTFGTVATIAMTFGTPSSDTLSPLYTLSRYTTIYTVRTLFELPGVLQRMLPDYQDVPFRWMVHMSGTPTLSHYVYYVYYLLCIPPSPNHHWYTISLITI